MPEKHKILILIEHFEGKLNSNTWEVIRFGQKLAEQHNFEIHAVIVGYEVENLAAQISERSGIKVVYITNERSLIYTPEVYYDLFLQAIQQESPFIVLIGHTYQAIDFVPKLATMLNRGFIPNCIDYQIEADRMVFVRSVYGGKLNQQVGLKGEPPYIISLQPGRFKGNDMRGTKLPKVIKSNIQVSENLVLKRKVLETIQGAKDKIDLTHAEIIVAGGRGLGSKESFDIIFDLANALGASVGATRPVIDGGWLPKGHQVGSSGQSVAPKVYIACGISGAIQHLVGMTSAGCIVAINKDPNAPIFNVADYGIVGDMFRIVPAMTETIKEINDIATIPIKKELN